MKEQFYFLQLKLQKDPEAFGKIYDIYADKIYRFIYFKVSTESIAEDLTSEVFLKAWQYIAQDKSKQIKNFNAFLYTLARNTVADYYRKNKATMVPIEVVNDIPDEAHETVTNDLDIASDMQRVEKILTEMKDEYREVIVLRFMEEMSINEIAEVLDKSSGATRVLLHRAVAMVKKLLA